MFQLLTLGVIEGHLRHLSNICKVAAMARAVILLSLVGSVSAFLPQPARGFAHPSRSATVVAATKKSFGSFDEMLQNFEEPVLVDFYATWCGPCQQLSPILEDLQKELNGRLHVAKVDTEKYQNIATKYSVEGLPTVVLFKGGKEVHRLMGLYNKEQLISELGPFL